MLVVLVALVLASFVVFPNPPPPPPKIRTACESPAAFYMLIVKCYINPADLGGAPPTRPAAPEKKKLKKKKKKKKTKS